MAADTDPSDCEMRMWQLIAKKNHDLLSNTTRLQTPPATLEVTRSAALVLDA